MRPASSTTARLASKRRHRIPVLVSGPGVLVRETTLLNIAIFILALVIAILLGSVAALMLLTFIVMLVSVILWTATFAVVAFVSLSRNLWKQCLRSPGQPPRHRSGVGVGDPWLDGPA